MKGELRLTSNGARHSVHLDGVDIGGALTGLTVRIDAGDGPLAVLDVRASELSADLGDAHLHLPDATRDLLIRFGWTPPQDAIEGGDT